MSRRLESRSGLAIEVNANGSIRRIDYRGLVVNLFPGNEVEGGPANLYLRLHGERTHVVPLLGPCSPAAFFMDGQALRAAGHWKGIRFSLALKLAASAPAWFWQVRVENECAAAQTVDLVYAQDMALAAYGKVRLNEHYVSHYVDHTPLAHAVRGWVVASRQNIAADGRNPWALLGSLRRGVAFATDAIELHGLAARTGATPAGLADGLAASRLQHEHSLVAIQDAPARIAAGDSAVLGFFGWIEADHPGATQEDDLAFADRACALREALWTESAVAPAAQPPRPATLFAPVRLLESLDLERTELDELFGARRRHEESEGGRLLSFFDEAGRHVALRAKELEVLRPHGHILRTGLALTPDESSLTSTAWMGGVFHSMVTQGHVGINRFLSTVRSYLGLCLSHGQRVFVELEGEWNLLGLPSAWEIAPDECRWIYKHALGMIEVRSRAGGGRQGEPHELGLAIRLLAGPRARFMICNHVALGGDDGSAGGRARYVADDEGIFVRAPAGCALKRRFPRGGFRIAALPGTVFERVGGDELLFRDGRTRREPFICIVTAIAESAGLRVTGELVADGPDVPAAADANATGAFLAMPRISAPDASPHCADVSRLSEILPWYAHDALIHYLAPRGLEQFSGGGWGTRDVCQGPVELLLAFGRTQPVRELLLRTFAAQNPDGDWPQWFTFFARERHLRADDAHGDVVFWPLLALARYLVASEDAGILDEPVPFFHSRGATQSGRATVGEHVERALALIETRTIPGTRLAAYGHGDWNDALQPADPGMRARMCSAWTVTLHAQVLKDLSAAMRRLNRHDEVARFERKAREVQADFERLLIVDRVVAGYAVFGAPGQVDYLLHPRDRHTGVRLSLLPMIHAILADMLDPQQAREHLALVASHLHGPDGARLFDRPMQYRGGPQRFFQRAEASAFFGREIGLMYTHAHLRYAQALAHVGDAEGFFAALCRANPIGIGARVPAARLRQANCYYSSSDAAFRDRYEASDGYDRIARGEVALEGGWRIYSSGPGIGVGLVVRDFLGIRREKSLLVMDPVVARSLDGLRASVDLAGRRVDVTYRVGGAGCGPTALVLNGKALPFARAANPYRLGGAEVPMAIFSERLTDAVNSLTVQVG